MPKWQQPTSDLDSFSFLDKIIAEMIAIFIILLKEEKDSELGWFFYMNHKILYELYDCYKLDLNLLVLSNTNDSDYFITNS